MGRPSRSEGAARRAPWVAVSQEGGIEAPLQENPDIHSDFNLSAVLIRVNTLHPDYQRESTPQERKESYLVRLIAKEMTLYEYPDTAPENLLEKLLDLDLSRETLPRRVAAAAVIADCAIVGRRRSAEADRN